MLGSPQNTTTPTGYSTDPALSRLALVTLTFANGSTRLRGLQGEGCADNRLWWIAEEECCRCLGPLFEDVPYSRDDDREDLGDEADTGSENRWDSELMQISVSEPLALARIVYLGEVRGDQEGDVPFPEG